MGKVKEVKDDYSRPPREGQPRIAVERLLANQKRGRKCRGSVEELFVEQERLPEEVVRIPR